MRATIILSFIFVYLWSLPSVQAKESKEVKEYKREFEQYFHRDVSKIKIRFVGLIDRLSIYGGVYIGFCNFSFSTYNTIDIDERFWYQSEPFMRKILLFHELGHCALYKRHDDSVFPDGCPKSIMISRISIPKCYKLHYNELIQDLGHP